MLKVWLKPGPDCTDFKIVSNTYENFGKYILLEKLATGGMAEVFLARGTGAGGIGKFFAIKRILPQYADSPEFIEMFKAEAKIAINLNHSNIVSIHEFGIERGQFFLVMDYVEGRNLRQILNKMKKSSLQFSIDQIVYLIKEVAAGLDHAHRTIDGSTGKPLNITHRDMSPQNIMATFEGEAKIVDFGIAKAESQIENTRAGTLKGKFGYMSPEQAEGQPVDLRTDIFSLGIVLWELLAHDRLFVANNEINTLRKIRDCQIPSLRKLNPNIHAELERIVQKALARDRNLRYQTGAALHRDLSRYLNRQFPDFSVQDFAVFIKSVFADEILSIRKRLVEYTRLNPDDLQNSGGRDPGGDTALLNADTGSVVMTGSASQTDTNDGSVIHGLNQSLPALTPAPVQTQAKANAGSSASEDPTQMLDSDTGEVTLVPPSQSAPTFLDEAALERASRRPADSEVLETEDMPVAAPPRRPSAPRATESRRPQPTAAAASNSPHWATLVIFACVCFGAYMYLAKYQTETMTPVIAALDPILHPVHQAIGVDLAQRSIAAAASARATPAAVPTPAAVAVEEPKIADREDRGVVVTSNPSGGEIFLNDQSTGLSTPNRIEIALNANFSVSVKKRGYHDYRRAELTLQSLGHRLDANLQKLTYGYLDVEIFPPQDAVLFVNNRQVPLRRAIAQNIAVPGNVPIRVRAQSPNGATFDEVTLTVPIDHRKTVQINPRKQQRLPASK